MPAGLSVEVIVVDNASRDDTAEAVRQASLDDAQLKYVSEPTPGQSRARNRGLAAADGDIIVFIDDDVIPATDWLGKLCAPILRDEADAVAGCVRLAPHLIKPWMSASHRDWLADTCSIDAANPSRMVGANMAFARVVLDRIPAFDVELGPGALGFGDDTLFSLQARAAGFRIVSAFDAVVEHHFMADRLAADNWVQAAKKLGQVDAYISHHWDRDVWPRPRRGICSSLLKVARCRLGRLSRRDTPATPELLSAVRSFHAGCHYLRVRNEPWKYEKRGLVKLTPGPAMPPRAGMIPAEYSANPPSKA
jgi:glycosyltransferase involved in cell wall biosynthesis